jgi:hypothetical protein
MAINNEFPILDGIAPSWADILVRATPAGAPLIDMKEIKSISTGTTVEVGEQRGASGGRVMKRTTGSKSDEAASTLYRNGYQGLLRNLKAIAPKRTNGQRVVSLVHFGIQVQHTPPGLSDIFEYRIKGCRLLGRQIASEEGNDADTVDLTLNPLEIADMIDGEEVVFL